MHTTAENRAMQTDLSWSAAKPLVLALLVVVLGLAGLRWGASSSDAAAPTVAEVELTNVAANVETVPAEAVLGIEPPVDNSVERGEPSRVEVPTTQAQGVAPNADHPIQGRVVDALGAPLQGAEIWLTQANSTRLTFEDTNARTDGDGRFSLDSARCRVFAVLAVAEGLGGAIGGTYTLSGRTSVDVDLACSDGPGVSGLVTWDGIEPAAGATLEVFGRLTVDQFHEPESEVRDGVEGFSRIGWARTDASGGFQVKGLIADSVRLRATATADDGSTHVAFLESVAAGSADLALRLQPMGTVEFLVTDDQGTAVPEVRVRAMPLMQQTPKSGEPEEQFQVLEPVDGVATMDGLFEGRWRFAVFSKGYWTIPGSKPPEAEVPATRRLSVRLARSASISGSVRAAGGAAVSGVEVRLTSDLGPRGRPLMTTLTDDDGRYTFESLNPAARYLIRVAQGTEAAFTDLSLQSGELRELAPVTLAAGTIVRVVVLDAAGNPWPERPVRPISLDGQLLGTSLERLTDEAGEAVFSQLPPGRFLIVASGKESLAVTGSPVDAELMRVEVDLEPGETVEVELREVALNKVQFKGTVRLDGALAQGRGILFLRDGAMKIEAGSGHRTDGEGRYSGSVPKPGLYRWVVGGDTRRGPPIGTGWVEISDSPGNVDLEVRTGTIEVTADGVEAGEWAVLITPRFSALGGPAYNSTGQAAARVGDQWVLEALAPGRYLVRGLVESGPHVVASQEVEVLPGAVARVHLTALELQPLRLELEDLVLAGEDEPRVLHLVVWGEGANPIAEIPMVTPVNPIEVRVPASATQLAVAYGSRVAHLTLGDRSPSETVKLRGVAAGRLQIVRPKAAAVSARFALQVLDAHGRNWAGTPSAAAHPISWMMQLAVAGRWTSTPLPPGKYTVKAEGRTERVEIQAQRTTQLAW